MNLPLLLLLMAALPGFEQFQKVDQQRRESGQWESTEAAALLRVDPARIMAVAEKAPADPLLQWGAAELLGDWTNRQVRFEAALSSSGTNIAIALRYATAAASQGRRDLAAQLVRLCQGKDPSNAVPWVVAAWLQQQVGGKDAVVDPPATAKLFSDGEALAARARIKVLEQIGYSPYATRRIGYNAEHLVQPMLLQLVALGGVPKPWLRQVALAMQQKPTFLVTELVGQTIENGLGADVERVAELKQRREELLELTRTVGLEIVPQAREAELVNYYDEMLTLGEEQALQRLKATVEAGRQRR